MKEQMKEQTCDRAGFATIVGAIIFFLFIVAVVDRALVDLGISDRVLAERLLAP